MNINYIIYPGEAEVFIQSLKPFSYEHYGSQKWFNHHTFLNKLNIQVNFFNF